MGFLSSEPRLFSPNTSAWAGDAARTEGGAGWPWYTREEGGMCIVGMVYTHQVQGGPYPGCTIPPWCPDTSLRCMPGYLSSLHARIPLFPACYPGWHTHHATRADIPTMLPGHVTPVHIHHPGMLHLCTYTTRV